MFAFLLNQQLLWLGAGVGAAALGIHAWTNRSLETRGPYSRLPRILVAVGTGSLATFAGLVVVQGITFWSITSASNLGAVFAAAVGYALGGTAFLVMGGYLFSLVGDLLPGLGYAKPPSPIGGLVNLSPTLTIAIIMAFGLFMLFKQKGRMEAAVRHMWGIKYLVLLVALGVLATPFYSDQKVHLYVLLDTYWLILLLPVLACFPANRVERITRWLLLASFWLRVGIFIYQIITRPLYLSPQMMSLSASKVDNVFRLGGIAYGANNSSLTLLTLLPFGLAQISRARLPRWTEPLALVVLGYIVYRTDTRATWVGFVVVLLIYFALLREWRSVIGTLALAAVAGLFLPYLYAKLVLNLTQTGGILSADNNLAARFTIWSFALRSALTNVQAWFLGIGWASEPLPWSLGIANWFTLHSLWVAVLVRSGITGLLAWVLFVGDGLWNTWCAALHASGIEKSWLVAGVASWIGFLFFALTANADWPQPTQMIAVISVNLWALSQTSRSKELADETSSPKGGYRPTEYSRGASPRDVSPVGQLHWKHSGFEHRQVCSGMYGPRRK